jgi:hypothetical protein
MDAARMLDEGPVYPGMTLGETIREEHGSMSVEEAIRSLGSTALRACEAALDGTWTLVELATPLRDLTDLDEISGSIQDSLDRVDDLEKKLNDPKGGTQVAR